MKVGRMFINGKWKTAVGGATREIFNPANNKVIGVVTEGSKKDAELAIKAARKAFDEGPWPQMRAGERASYLFKLADLIEANAEEFAKTDTLNNGKPLREARFDAGDAAGCFRYYAGLITKPLGQNYEVSDATIEPMVVREPIGVCAQIIPWNYPLLMAAWKLAPGLAAGNCCILKPAETTPLSAIRLFELIEKAGFPPGSAQLVLGPGPTVGQTLAESMLVDKVAFTGGTATGRKIMQAATTNIKKVTLELGGKSPNIVFADADLDVALEFAMFGIFAGQGEVCSAGSRLLLEKKIAKKFLSRLAEASDKIVVGDGMNPKTEMGPLITPMHMQKVLGYIEAGKREGAELICGGQAPNERQTRRGQFCRPDRLRENQAGDDHSARGNFRARARRATFRDRGGSASPRQRHRLRPGRRGVHQRRREGPARPAQTARRHHLAEHLSPDLQRSALGRLQAVGHRPRARHLRPRCLHGGEADQHQSRPAAAELVRWPEITLWHPWCSLRT